ncbi:hypothetical protein GCM10018771_59650 [Streptomyces cellulosae]|nr:hypothetical protein GCM10018771_59650 [Streptomyces cellulosae]
MLDGDYVVFDTGAATVKGRNLARDVRITLRVDDDRPPFAYVTWKAGRVSRRSPGSCGTGPPGSAGGTGRGPRGGVRRP